MSKRQITYRTSYTSVNGLRLDVEITVRAENAESGAEIATRELRAVVGSHSSDMVYSDQVVRIESSAR